MNHWETIKLKEVTEKVGSGATPRGGFNSYKSSGIPLIRSMNVHFDGLRLEGLAYLDDKQADELKNVEVKADDVLLNITGASIGRVTQAPKKLDGARVNQHVCIIRPIPVLDPKFLYKYLSSPSIQAMIMDKEYGGTRQALTKQMILEFDIPIPPLNEQRRIVAKIEALKARSQRVKEELEAIAPLLDQFRQSVLAAAFRGDLTADWREKNPDIEPASVLLERIRAERRRRWEEAELEKMKAQRKTPKDDKWKEKYKDISSRGARQLVTEIRAGKYKLDNLPAGWSAIRLGQISQLQTGYAFKSNWFASDGIRLLRGTNIVPGNTRWEDVVYLPEERTAEFEEYMLQKGDIIIAMDRPVISSGLKIAKLGANDVPSLLLQRVGRFKLEEGIEPDFILSFLNSQIFLSHIQDQATGTQLPHISANDVESVIIPLPPVKEQKAIVKLINAWSHRIDSVTELTHSGFADLEALNQSILAKAFRGELVLQDPNDEPASVLLERISAEREKLDTKKKAKGKSEKKSRKAKPEPAEPEQLSLPGFE